MTDITDEQFERAWAASGLTKFKETGRAMWDAAIALQPSASAEPVAWRIRYRSEPGMIGHYPWTYTERKPKTPRPEHEVEPVYASPVTAAREQEGERPTLASLRGLVSKDQIAPSSSDEWEPKADLENDVAHWHATACREQQAAGEYLIRAEEAEAKLAALTTSTTGKVDVEQMLRDCVPGGSSCDPQAICDDIRAWFAGKVDASRVCQWTYEDDPAYAWATQCGQMHAFTDGGPAENSHRFCCYCGGRLGTPKSAEGEGA